MKLLIIVLLGISIAAPAQDLVDKAIYKKYGIPYGDKWYSGYLPIDDAKEFHYFYFPAVSLAQAVPNGGTPVILWLNGGPGCSSVFGALNENGPFTYPYGEAKFVKNEYAWTNFVYIIMNIIGRNVLLRITRTGWLFFWK